MQVTTSAGIGCFVFAPRSFLSRSSTLPCRSGCLFCRATITAIGSNRPIVYFTGAAIRFAAVTGHAQQLNVRRFTASTTRKGSDMVVFEIGRTSAAITGSSVTGKDDFFGRFRNIPTLRKAGNAD
jgi:hypothetical protein